MKRRTLLAGTAALAAMPAVGRAAEKTKIIWWHAMTAALADQVNHLVDAFNQSQDAIEVQAIYKGGYSDVLTATIAAFRAGQAPHLVQIFEVGTGSMLAAGKATKQVWELIKETGVAIDPEAYIPAVRGYYSLADGRMASMPFNSSTAMMWYSKDAFRKAGLDPDKPPATWQDVMTAAQAIKAKDAAEIPVTSSWLSWIQLEQYSALHNIPFASKVRRVRRTGRAARNQQRGACEAHAAAARHGEGRHVQIRRPRQPAGSVAAVRQGRHPLQLVRRARRHGEEREVRLGRGIAAVRSGADQIAAQFHHRRREPVDDDRSRTDAGGIQGGRDVPAVHRQTGQRCLLASAHRLRAGDACGLRAVAAAGVLREERRRRSAGEATDARHGHRATRRDCGWGGWSRSATSSTRKWRRRSRAARPRSRRWTARSAAATRCCGSSRSR